MEEKTWISGKDEALEDTIAALQSCLQALDIELLEIATRNPVPHVWSVSVQDAACPLCFASGMGTSRDAARASAMAQFVERLACNDFFSHYYLGEEPPPADFFHYPQERWYPADDNWPRGLIDDPVLQSLYNPEGSLTPAHLVDASSYRPERGVCALPFTRLADGQTQWFPVNLISNLYDSNGMAAGNNPQEARIQALSELLERHVKFRVVAEGIALPRVPQETLSAYPQVCESLQALAEHGLVAQVRDASLGGKYPVMSLVLFNPVNGGCAMSFGAHPRREVALQRALTELLQERDLEHLQGFAEPGLDVDDYASDDNLEAHFVNSSGVVPWRCLRDEPDTAFIDWDYGGETEAEYRWICELFAEDGRAIYVADYEHLGFYACRLIVPGLSEVYPADNLEWDNDNAVAPWRATLLNLHNCDDDQLLSLREWLEELGCADNESVAALIGIAADPDSPWEALRIGHLKLWLALALQDDESLAELTRWAIHHGVARGQDVRLYRCLAVLEGMRRHGLDPQLHGAGLDALYPAEMIRLARSLIAGCVRFPGLHDPGLALDDLKHHRALLDVFHRLRRHQQSAVASSTPAEES